MQKGRNKNDDDDSNNKNDEKAFLREKSFLRWNKKCECFDSIRSGGEQVALREGTFHLPLLIRALKSLWNVRKPQLTYTTNFMLPPPPSLPAEVIHDLDIQSLPGQVDDEDATPPQ
jgi:hypothetical protein